MIVIAHYKCQARADDINAEREFKGIEHARETVKGGGGAGGSVG